MKSQIFPANERGYADHGWLKANYSFSFANYYNPRKEHFGALRVLNDDIIQGGMGFGEHPHQNMEIISVPLEGALKHRDSMTGVWQPLEAGEVQVMSAGKGIYHSEMNNSPSDFVNLFQIWIFPEAAGIEPRYDQKRFDEADRINQWQTLVSSTKDPIEGSLTIHQDARISRVDLNEPGEIAYDLMSLNHGAYVMLINGTAQVGEHKLFTRDAVGIWNTEKLTIQADESAEVLVIEVPMSF